jgi:hypothetical protein
VLLVVATQIFRGYGDRASRSVGRRSPCDRHETREDQLPAGKVEASLNLDSADRPRLRHDGTREPTEQDRSVAPERPPDT